MSEERDMLLVRAGGRICALPVGDVLETCRPSAVSPLAGTPPFVLGATVLRGAAAPVVSLGQLLTGDPGPAPRRLVVLRCGQGRAALAVEEVLGVRRLAGEVSAPPALDRAAGGALESAAALGPELVYVLRSVRLVPEEAWRALAQAGREA